MQNSIRQDIRAIIFDVDGTLAETEEAHRLAFNQAFQEAGLSWHWTVQIYKNLLKVTGGKERISHFMASSVSSRHLGEVTELVRRLHERKTEIYTGMVANGDVSLRPGIEPLIHKARAHGLKLGIATTTSLPNVEALLSRTLGSQALSWFAAVCCGDSVALKKPAPDIYFHALEQLCVPAFQTVAVEDSWNGVRSASTAGLRVLATPSLYSFDEDFSEATEVFGNAQAVARWIFTSG